MKNILITTIVIIAFLGVLVWVSRTQIPDTTGANVGQVGESKLVASESSYGFGSISMAAGNVTKRFTVRNEGSEPVTVRKLSTSCMCTTASLINGSRRIGPYGMPGHGSVPTFSEIIVPGQEAVVEVVFDPAAHGPTGVGPVNRAVYVEDSTGAVLELTFTATVTP